MVSFTSLCIPILVSAVFVFIASSIIHMLLRYHRNNFSKLPNEDGFRAAVGPLDIPPGEYIVPHVADPKDMGSEDYLNKIKQGPVGFLTFMPKQPWPMGKSLGLWFVYCLIVGAHTAYIAKISVAAGADYLTVMRVVGAASFAGYALALIQNSIWKYTRWTSTIKFLFDGLVYALITGGTFGWLWPSV